MKMSRSPQPRELSPPVRRSESNSSGSENAAAKGLVTLVRRVEGGPLGAGEERLGKVPCGKWRDEQRHDYQVAGHQALRRLGKDGRAKQGRHRRRQARQRDDQEVADHRGQMLAQ